MIDLEGEDKLFVFDNGKPVEKCTERTHEVIETSQETVSTASWHFQSQKGGRSHQNKRLYRPG